MAALGITLAATVIRAWGAFDIAGYTGDESFHVPSAINLARHGVALTSNWTHPPGGALILAATVGIFGDGPVGWRIGGILLGGASVGLLYLVALRLSGSRVGALLAALLLALDPLHIYYSRTTFMEIPVVCFFLLALWALLVRRDDRLPWALPLAGLAIGMTVATKAYFAGAIALGLAGTLLEEWRRGPDRGGRMVEFACWLLVLPLTVSLLANYHFFASGHILPEFLEMRGDALWTLRSLTEDSFVDRSQLELGGRPWEWFLKPIFFGFRFEAAEGEERYLLQLNNFPIRPVALAAIGYLAFRGVRERSALLLVPPAIFASVVVPFLVMNRPLMGYSALAALPFAYLALAWGVVRQEQRHASLRGISLTVTLLVLLLGCYQYPLATGGRAFGALHAPILSHTRWVVPSP